MVALAELHAAGVRIHLRDDGTVALNASGPPPAAVLALARVHRDGIAALLRDDGGVPTPGSLLPGVILAGVPASWCEGVARLATQPWPPTITPARWAVLAATSAHLMRDHGSELYTAGWDTLDLFGLHQRAPATNPPGWGLAWLLDQAGEVLDVAPDAVGMRREPDGARMVVRRGCAAARAGVVPAWALGEVST